MNLCESRSRLDRIEQLGAGQEHDAGARERQQHTAVSRIDFKVMAAALDRSER
jgi:hypothetical protein